MIPTRQNSRGQHSRARIRVNTFGTIEDVNHLLHEPDGLFPLGHCSCCRKGNHALLGHLTYQPYRLCIPSALAMNARGTGTP